MKHCRIFQRASALLCCILLLPSLAAVPVLAASDDEVFFDVLEFCTANDSGSQVVSGSLPMSVIYRTVQEPFRYIDMVVITDIPDLYITYAGNYLTTVLIGTNYGYTYRVYGNLVGDPSGYLAFTVGGSSGSWISFESMRVSSFTSSQESYATIGGIYVYPSDSNGIVYMPDAQTEVKRALYWNNNYNTYQDFRGEVYLSDWKKYDYIDVYMEYFTAGINSIGVSINNVAIPHTVTYLDSSFDHNSSIVEGSEFATTIRQRVMISIDLREVNRTIGYMPLIFFTGRYEGWSVEPSIILRSVTGFVVAESSSPLGTFWKNLVSTLNQHFQGMKDFLQGLFSGSEEFESEVDEGVIDFDEAESGIDEGLESLETPDTDDVDIIGVISDSGADTSTLKDFFAAAFDNIIVNWLMILSFSFMLISFLLYGSFR